MSLGRIDICIYLKDDVPPGTPNSAQTCVRLGKAENGSKPVSSSGTQSSQRILCLGSPSKSEGRFSETGPVTWARRMGRNLCTAKSLRKMGGLGGEAGEVAPTGQRPQVSGPMTEEETGWGSVSMRRTPAPNNFCGAF